MLTALSPRSHRLESQLNATAKVLDVDAQFVYACSFYPTLNILLTASLLIGTFRVW